MRSSLRVASALLFAVGLVTCSESPTAVHSMPLRLAFAPHFTPAQAAIYDNLASFAVTLDNVHVVVYATPPGDQPATLLKDTTIAFPASASEVTIDIDLTISGSQQTVLANVELRQGTTAYFQGAQTFVVKQGETTGASEAVEMGYVGPGVGATFMSIAPQPATLAPGGSFTFSALVLDQLEHTITNLPITWTTSDPSIASATEDGIVTATTKTGTFTLTAKGLNGISAQATVNVQPAVKLVVVSGGNQSGIVASALATRLEVQALDGNGNAVIGATITFGASGGSVSPASATTDASGNAATTLTLGNAIGTYTFTATVAGASNTTTRVTSAATSSAPAALGILAGNNQTDSVQATLSQPLTVRLTDAFGNPVSQQAIDFQVTAGRAGLVAKVGAAPAVVLHATTDVSGVAQVSLVADTLAGPVRVTASAPQTTLAAVSFAATVKPGLPAMLVMLQQPSAAAQATVRLGTQPRVQVADRFGNAVAGSGVLITASPVVDCTQSACGRLVPAGRGTPSLSRSQITVQARTRATSPTRQLSASASTIRIAIPTTIQRTQSVSDTFPRGLGGTTNATTDGNGIATFSDLSLDLFVGPWQLEFADTTTGSTLAPTFSSDVQLSPGPIQSIVAWGVADTTVILADGDTLLPSVRVIDKVGNGIPGVPVAWRADSLSTLDSLGTTTRTDANGIATPGTWVTMPLAGAVVAQYSIVATPQPANIENSPLSLYAILQPLIGRVVPLAAPTRRQ